jgi:hypothetical protein
MARNERPPVRGINQGKIPDVIVPIGVERIWVAGLIQTRGRIQAKFSRQNDATYLKIDLAMVDPEPVFIFSDCVGLSRPSNPVKNRWHRDIIGSRAFKVLQEIRSTLLGEKLKEAEKGISFFAPDGIHPGRFTELDIWPPSEFPWRIRRRGLPSSDTAGAAASSGPGLGGAD